MTEEISARKRWFVRGLGVFLNEINATAFAASEDGRFEMEWTARATDHPFLQQRIHEMGEYISREVEKMLYGEAE